MLYLFFGVIPVISYGGEFLLHLVPYLAVNQLLFVVVGYGVKTWRGHQYSLALFPIWIRACVTAAGNVWLGHSLGFIVTPKTRQAAGPAWRVIRAQLVAIGLLVLAVIVGLIRFGLGLAPTTEGTAINLIWVAYDLLVLSVIIQAARYPGYQASPDHGLEGNGS